MDFQEDYKVQLKNKLIAGIYQNMPAYLSSKHRLHKMFFKKCDESITHYESCIGNKNW